MGVIYSHKNDKYITHSQDETMQLAESFAYTLKGGEVILLHGDLGAGKTTFTKGIAKALSIKNIITSPTFTIMKQYYGDLALCHYDMYRINSSDEIDELGISDYLYEKDTVSVIEWNKFDDLKDYISIEIQYVNDNERMISFKEVNS